MNMPVQTSPGVARQAPGSWFRALFHAMPQRVVVKDRNLAYIFCNSKYGSDHGIAAEALIGRNDFDLFPSALAERYRDDDHRVLNEGAPLRVDRPYAAGDARLWMHMIKVPLRDAQGNVVGLIGTWEEVTVRKRPEGADVDAGVEVIEGLPAGVLVYAADGSVEVCNGEASRVLRTSLEEMRRGACRVQLLREDGSPLPEAEHPVRRAACERHPDRNRIVGLDHGGGEPPLWVLVNTFPELDADGSLVRVMVSFVDVTACRRAQEETMRAQVFLNSVIENIPHMVFVKDAEDLRFVSVNKAAEQLLGRTRAELVGRSDYDFFPREQADFFTSKDRDVLASGNMLDIPDEPVETPGQGLRYLRTKKLPVVDAAGRSRYLLGISEDVTERRQTEEALRRSYAEIEDLYNHAPCGYQSLDSEGRIVRINDTQLAWLGYRRDEIVERTVFADLLTGRSRSTFDSGFARLKTAGSVRDLELEVLRKDGSVLLGLFSATAIHDAHGNYVACRATLFDITERKRVEENLHLAEKVFAHSSEGVLITDRDKRILSVNSAFTAITGYEPAEVLGERPGMLKSDMHDRAFYRRMRRALREKGFWSGEVWDRRKDGGLYPSRLTINAVNDKRTSAVTHYIALFSDITERKASEEHIRRLAQYDFLTNLPNRVLFDDRLVQTLASAKRHNKLFAVMFLDLDRFKNVNDSLGHRAGDRLLQQVAERLRGALRESDTVCRQGGDEFVILLSEINYAEDVAYVAHKVIQTVSQPYQLQDRELVVTASVGISVFPDDGGDPDTLLKNADSAMYHAKSTGRNNYQFFASEMNERSFEALVLENALRRALERNEFELHYQPMLNTDTGRVVGMEALIRWHHPELGLVSPCKFIPVAEDSGLILPIGEWVVREACRQNKALQETGLCELPVSVNLSALQFRQHDIVEVVAEALAACDLEPRYLELEVTESAMVEDIERVIATLHGFRSLGVSLAVDDFGTGYSSLSYLKRFPIDKLKVDQSFVRDISTDPNDAAICGAVISLARSLHLAVVAEGVETEAQRAFLREHGCAVIQGFYVSRPMGFDDLTEYLRVNAAGGAARSMYGDHI